MLTDDPDTSPQERRVNMETHSTSEAPMKTTYLQNLLIAACAVTASGVAFALAILVPLMANGALA